MDYMHMFQNGTQNLVQTTPPQREPLPPFPPLPPGVHVPTVALQVVVIGHVITETFVPPTH